MRNENGKLLIGILLAGILIVLIVIAGILIYRTKLDFNIEENSEISKNNENISEDSGNIIVLYNGLDVSKADMELSIPYTDENKEKYEITYYNYEDGKFVGESKGTLQETYEGVAEVENTKKIAISQKYDAIPRQYKKIEEIPDELMEFADSNYLEIQSIDLDNDGKVEYVVSYGTKSSPEDYEVEEYSNFSEILVLDENYNKIDTLVTATNQFWEYEGEITDEFFCSLKDVDYIDIDNDGIMEILVDTNVYEGIGVNIYKYKDGKIDGEVDYELSVLP